MLKLGLNEIREKYLSFFESKGHLRLPSFSLVPKNDPSILLINAGMTPMKAYFTGAETPPSKRVTTCQKCIRTPDIEQVGHTARHGTFFEMLGNFSFGDYFKPEMIPWAYEFATEILKIEEERLYVSIYKDDDEAFKLWTEKVGLDKKRIYRFGKEDNFWEHGTGPCGPCSEIFYDRGKEFGCGRPDCGPGCECDRFIEFWNLVFTQFERLEDGTYKHLEKKNIDTGAGLERLACISQSVDNLFEVDTIRSVLDRVCSMAGKTYGQDKKTDIALRVITDHVRSVTMMISDGILPSNEGRGYVLRRLLRRSARFGRQLGIKQGFLAELAPQVINNSKGAYPVLDENKSLILSVIENEELRFGKTIEQGEELLGKSFVELEKNHKKTIPGETVFKLHDTYGFPFDLTREMAEEKGFVLDEDGFREKMRSQKEHARKAALDKNLSAWDKSALPDEIKNTKPTEFTGYERLSSRAEILFLFAEKKDKSFFIKNHAAEGDEISIVLDRTPFYATGGGQEADTGKISCGNAVIDVTSCLKTPEGVYIHKGKVLSGSFFVNTEVEATVDRKRRLSTARNHTATHMLQKALQIVLGDHVRQAGSLVNEHMLRFDFSHFEAMTDAEIKKCEDIVNEIILDCRDVKTRIMSIDEAKNEGAMALFDEKYGKNVRVVEIDNYSKELCAGTHLRNTSEAGVFKILSESSVASGVRRIEAVTGAEAVKLFSEDASLINELESELKSGKSALISSVSQLRERVKSLEKKISEAENKNARAEVDELIKKAEIHKGIRVLVKKINAKDQVQLREIADSVRAKLGSSAILLAAENNGKIQFVSMLSKDAVEAGLNAGLTVKLAAGITGGGGGGRADMAQAGGRDVSKLSEALAAAEQAFAEKLSED